MLKALIRLAAAAALVTCAARPIDGGAEQPYTIPFADFVKIVDATVCAAQNNSNASCEPQRVALAPRAGAPEIVLTCPLCLVALDVAGATASGTLRGTRRTTTADVAFRTEAPSGDALAAQTARLSEYNNARYFVRATRPRGLSIDNGALLVADFGSGHGDGRIWRVPLGHDREPLLAPVDGEVIADSLPSVEVATNFQGYPFKAVVGVSSARRVDGALLVLTNRIAGKEFEIPELRGVPVASLMRVGGSNSHPAADGDGEGDHTPHIIASLADFEFKFDPDHHGPESNPYDFVERDGQIFATDAAGNTVVRINPRTGATSLYAVLDDLARAHPVPGARATADPVPTSLTFGPDGALYVACVAGYPFAPGSGRIVRLADSNGDGDALDPGEQTVVVTGLTMAIGVTFDSHGTMYTAEHSLVFSVQGPGRICRIENGRCAEVLAAHPPSPTSLVAADGYLYYSQEFLGRVGRIPIAAR